MTNATHFVQNPNPRFYNEEISAYDALPQKLRERIAFANYTISSKSVYMIWQLTRNLEQCLTAIEQIETAMEKGDL